MLQENGFVLCPNEAVLAISCMFCEHDLSQQNCSLLKCLVNYDAINKNAILHLERIEWRTDGDHQSWSASSRKWIEWPTDNPPPNADHQGCSPTRVGKAILSILP